MAGPRMETIAGANTLTTAEHDESMARLMTIHVNDRFCNGKYILKVTTALKTGPINGVVF